MRHSPSLPELVRVDTTSLDSAIGHLISALEPSGGGFNYLDATKRVRAAYKGLHDLSKILASHSSTKRRVGHDENVEVVRLAAPRAFSRWTPVLDLPPRKLPYGGDRLASYRIPFFFIEQGVVKAYFLQPRKNTHFSSRQFGLFATLVKKHLLDMEFYGELTDLEIVDVSRPPDQEKRTLKVLELSDLVLWTDSEIEEHFLVVTQALKVIEQEQLVSKVRRPLKDKDLTLFD